MYYNTPDCLPCSKGELWQKLMSPQSQLLNTLPYSVSEDVRKTLCAYSMCLVRFYNGEYHVSTGVMICSTYPEDYKVIGDFESVHIFTEDERIVNYIETFYDYPTEYKGSRDYNMLRYMSEQGGTAKVRLEGGTARLVI